MSTAHRKDMEEQQGKDCSKVQKLQNGAWRSNDIGNVFKSFGVDKDDKGNGSSKRGTEERLPLEGDEKETSIFWSK